MKKSFILHMLIIGFVLNNFHGISAMERYSDSSAEYNYYNTQKERGETIRSVINMATIVYFAAILGVTVGYLAYAVKKYKQWGVKVITVATRYAIPFEKDFLDILSYAKNHADKSLKERLLRLNKSLLGSNWREQKPKLVTDFAAMNRFVFVKLYNWKTWKSVAMLLKIYSAASDLYFRGSKFSSYRRGTPSADQKIEYMRDLEQKLQIAD